MRAEAASAGGVWLRLVANMTRDARVAVIVADMTVRVAQSGRSPSDESRHFPARRDRCPGCRSCT